MFIDKNYKPQRLASIMPFAPVGNLIDTEVRQRRVKRSASSRVRMTMRGLPEPTDVERWKKPAAPQKKRSAVEPLPELRRMPTPLSPTCWGDDDEPAARTDGLGGMDERVIDDAAVTARYRNARLIDDAAVRSPGLNERSTRNQRRRRSSDTDIDAAAPKPRAKRPLSGGGGRPLEAVRERRRARQIADMELAAARERENAKLEVSRAILEKMACGRVATRLGAVLEDAREKRVRDLAATAIQAWARGLRAKEKRRIVRKLSRFVPLTLWRRRERNRLAAKQLRKFFLDHERPARVKRHIHDFLRAGKLVQRIYRGYAACTVARRKALGMLWQRAEAAFAPPRERRPLAPVKPRNGSPDEARAFARRKILARREDQRDDAKRRDDARGLARLDRQWDVVDARMAHLVRPEEAPAKRRKEQKWAMPAKVRDAVLRAILGDARARHQATWDVSQREKYRSAPEVFTRRQARTILRLGDIKKRAAPLPPNAKAGKAWPTLFLFVQGDDTLAAIVARAYAAAYAADKEVHLRGGGADVAAAALRALGLVK